MDKKDLKFYVSPVVETMDLELEAQLMAGSPGDGTEESNIPGTNTETPGEEI